MCDHLCLGFKDAEAEKLYPSDGPAGFEPIQTYGDGNCLYRAMSRILCGTEDMHVELRVRSFMELCLKKDLYYDDTYLKTLTGLNDYKTCLLDSSFDTYSTVKGKNKLQRQQEGFEAGIIDTIKPHKYSNIWHIFALANVTGCTINSIYPRVSGSLIDRRYMNVRISPEKTQHPEVAYLMWTNTKNTNLQGWSPNHFVPLMPIAIAQSPAPHNQQSTSSSSKSTSAQVPTPDRKRNINQPRKDDPIKKTKYMGSFMYNAHFSTTWTQQWPYIVPSSKSTSHFYCTICNRTLSCAKQGVRDVRVHLETMLHSNNAKKSKTQMTLHQACASSQNAEEKVCITI